MPDAALATRLAAELAVEAEAALGRADGRAFLHRLAVRFADIEPPLRALYGDRHDVGALLGRLVRLALKAAKLLSVGWPRVFLGASSVGRWAARRTVNSAYAHMANVIWRYHPVQLRTSY